jgi:hypothetical protein
VLDGAALQANVPADAEGTTTFDYKVDDGRENGTATESVTVKVVPMEENNPPVQSGEPVLQVGQEGLGSIKVLPYFKDPDGDDLFLSNASTENKLDEVRFRPDGTVEFRDGGTTTGHKIVDVTVSDAEGLPVEGKLKVNVVPSNVPPLAVQDHVTVLAGEPVTVSPLKNDYDPNGDELRLTRVDGPKSVTISPNQTAATFTFESDEPGSYDITYQVTDGPNPTMGLVRVDVTSPPSEAGAPVAVSDQVLLPTGGTALVDVLANDTDPVRLTGERLGPEPSRAQDLRGQAARRPGGRRLHGGQRVRDGDRPGACGADPGVGAAAAARGGSGHREGPRG